jgi:tellurite resistance protein TerC
MSPATTANWIVFGASVLVLLGIDIYVHRGAHADTRRRAMLWTVFWVSAGLLFNVYVWITRGAEAGQLYLAAYLMEESLSIDNLFVFLIIFRSLRIPNAHQRKALSWGIFGALFFRAIFIFVGAEALERWEWVMYIFALLLLYAAWHAYREDPGAEEDSMVVEWLERHLPVSRHTKEAHFFTRESGKLQVTPLLVAVIGLELTDVMFAIDSVPAAFSVFDDPKNADQFIVYSSNVFAILGLRSIYIAMSAALTHLRYLHYGLAAVLTFAAGKMLTHKWIEIEPLWSVGIIVACIGVSIWTSIRAEERDPRIEVEETDLTDPTVPDAQPQEAPSDTVER